MRTPSLLAPGSRVALVAPAGPLRDAGDVEHALASAHSFGWEPVVGSYVLERTGYLAGSDEHRLADFNRFAADPSVHAIWCLRGGYGCMRLLDGLDYEAWRRHPKTLIGYSDITALHAAIGKRAELVTYHGPTARARLTEFTRASLRAAVVEGQQPCGPSVDAITLCGGRARGRLVGGNLALVAAICGTPFAPSFDDALVVFEDVNEAVYRIDRMLTQLKLSGAFDRIAGIAFGRFTDIPAEPGHEERPLLDLLREVAAERRVPCVANIPLGHIDDQWTVPLGAFAELDADARTLTVEL
ncbi:MAG TPA: LD-carboxypeptidase [Gemmatimonadaceae bacterium]